MRTKLVILFCLFTVFEAQADKGNLFKRSWKSKLKSRLGAYQDKIFSYVDDYAFKFGLFGRSKWWTGEKREQKVITEIITYECCYGFSRKVSSVGCPIEEVLKDPLTILRSLKLDMLSAALSEFKILKAKQNYTIFAASNNQIIGLERKVKDDILKEMRENKYDFVTINRADPSSYLIDRENMAMERAFFNQIVKGFVKLRNSNNNFVFQNIDPTSSVRINIFNYPKRISTANCVPIVSEIIHSKNAIIYRVKDTLPIVDKTLLDIIQRPEYSEFLNALKKSNINLLESLDDMKKRFTIFLPTNEAFKRLKKNQCLKNILLSHILPDILCSTVLANEMTVLTLLEKQTIKITLQNDTITINDQSRIIKRDIMARNGVIHVIDQALTLESAKSAYQIVEKHNRAAEFALLIKAGENLKNFFRELDDYTILVPQASSLKEMKKKINDIEEFVKYHTIQGLYPLKNKQTNKIETYAGKSIVYKKNRRKSIFDWISRSHKSSQFQCSRLLTYPILGCKSSIVFISEPLHIPSGNFMNVLRAEERFKAFYNLLVKTALSQEVKRLNYSVTILAPITELPDVVSSYDEKELKEFLKRHILTRI
ncbi:DgyrCDS2269 [Dimorphilus gyrociliatus]|uniref:DgyrCDS2269 n=1 Tax=Dimorphilus gyrociliatus TaxID=2664684 RepID=A0A7I8VBL2_9ANNE|nr:DgyrCDS2269 [Dimorphilus gyrociliatus]